MVLVLNADYSPLTRVDWRRAVTLLVQGIARPVEDSKFYKIVRTVTKEFLVPKAIVLIKFVRSHFKKRVPWSKKNIFIRDNYVCQYCGVQLNRHTATVDHILPRSRGGKNTFENCVTACAECNVDKQNRTPGEAGLVLRTKPYQPTIHEFCQKLMEED